MTAHSFDLARIGAGLPVAGARDELERAARVGAMVVTAPPGTGKTTFVPPLVANLVRDPAKTLLTQPRRVAARAAARRISELDGSAIGGPVGFTVRGERRVNASTRIEVLTPGVLLRRLIDDPGLEGVGAVVLDEVHERSVAGDLLLGMLAEVRTLRDDLLIVAMSATLDAARVAELMGGDAGPAPVVDVPSPLHPLRVDYAPFAGSRIDERGVTRDYLAHVAEVAARAQAAEGCDALVFVPGAREVDEVVRLLRSDATNRRVGRDEATNRGVEILPLHGRMPAREQDRALQGHGPSDPRRIVVSTSLAESSLTVPGVHLVVDAGLAREVRRDRGRDMAGLVTVAASRSSAEQRAGRAARQGPGRAVRVYSEADFARMPRQAQPEIASADLTDAALLLAAWGTPGAEGLALPSDPPAAAMEAAVSALRSLHLVDDSGSATALGQRVARMPVGAREARALIEGTAETGDPRAVAEVIAAISDDHREPGADLAALLRALRTGRAPGADRWKREVKRLARLVDDRSCDPLRGRRMTENITSPPSSSAKSQELTAGAGTIVALTRPEWIARRSAAGSRSYLLASGTRAALPEGSPLIGSDWIAVHEVQREEGRAADGTGAVIRLAAALDEADAVRIGGLTERRTATIEGGKVRVREERRVGAILISDAPAQPTRADTVPAFAAHLRQVGLAALHWNDAATALRNRLGLLRRELGEPWPDVGDAALLEAIGDWLDPDLARLSPSSPLASIDTASALRRLLPWPDAARLDELAPERLAVPSGSRVRIDYPAPDDTDARPVVAVKLQEVFGLAATPRLAEGRAPVLFHLLSPARRPLAVTDDLASFWEGPYQDVRREMRGRYPKHPWPEDPWTAAATARTKKRSGA